jgi:hypothetical protein
MPARRRPLNRLREIGVGRAVGRIRDRRHRHQAAVNVLSEKRQTPPTLVEIRT